ncbi:hypothetical protein [Bdellovibrio sp.]|uniref:hypothetical protein n=1 Tax=Bdellovibrio sp. TaxID=28201 RepID=UPI0039E5E32D
MIKHNMVIFISLLSIISCSHINGEKRAIASSNLNSASSDRLLIPSFPITIHDYGQLEGEGRPLISMDITVECDTGKASGSLLDMFKDKRPVSSTVKCGAKNYHLEFKDNDVVTVPDIPYFDSQNVDHYRVYVRTTRALEYDKNSMTKGNNFETLIFKPNEVHNLKELSIYAIPLDSSLSKNSDHFFRVVDGLPLKAAPDVGEAADWKYLVQFYFEMNIKDNSSDLAFRNFVPTSSIIEAPRPYYPTTTVKGGSKFYYMLGLGDFGDNPQFAIDAKYKLTHSCNEKRKCYHNNDLKLISEMVDYKDLKTFLNKTVTFNTKGKVPGTPSVRITEKCIVTRSNSQGVKIKDYYELHSDYYNVDVKGEACKKAMHSCQSSIRENERCDESKDNEFHYYN